MPIRRPRTAGTLLVAAVAALTVSCGPHATSPGAAGGSTPAPPPASGPSGRPSGTADPSPTPTPGAEIQHAVEGTGRVVALTFDDGPDPEWTPKVLRLLEQHHAKATFCMIGRNAARHPDLVRQVVAAGHRLCDHSMHHNERQSRQSEGYNRHEIVDAQQLIQKAAGPGGRVWYYRAPGGDFTPVIRRLAAVHGLRPLGWEVDAQDWRRPGVDTILGNIHASLAPGKVLLMHDGGGDRSQSVAALGRLLDELDSRSYHYAFPRW
ncbi:polysaccharide deacetylase family protein [Streptomyces sp. NPDC015131]|uniref:polysaccharide deacetylase family protein n=1 Tax=Streptomyces sp. NPDC015131 TaxID=3364941 RepID=UPI0036F8939B